jgi:hypothetical protein
LGSETLPNDGQMSSSTPSNFNHRSRARSAGPSGPATGPGPFDCRRQPPNRKSHAKAKEAQTLGLNLPFVLAVPALADPLVPVRRALVEEADLDAPALRTGITVTHRYVTAQTLHVLPGGAFVEHRYSCTNAA